MRLTAATGGLLAACLAALALPSLAVPVSPGASHEQRATTAAIDEVMAVPGFEVAMPDRPQTFPCSS